MLYPNWGKYFGNNGYLSHDLSYSFAGRTQETYNLFYHLSALLPQSYLTFIFTMSLLVAFAYTFGLCTRIATILLFLIQNSMITQNPFVVSGEDMVLRMILFYGIFAPMNGAIAVDNFLFKKTKISSGRLWILRAAQLNFLAIYVFSLPDKLLLDPGWLNGTFMYYVLNNDMWSRWQWGEFAANYYVSATLTYGALLAEFLLPILIWIKRWRNIVVLAGMTFHLLIAIFLSNVTFFSLMMICGLTLFWDFERSSKKYLKSLSIV
jgi:hypothetical protein